MVGSRSGRAPRTIVVAVAALFATAAAGCFGQFRATHAVYDFNREASNNRVVRSLLMCALVLTLVYPIAALIDMLVLHTLDFINGTNQVATETLPDGSELRMARLDARTVRVTHVDKAGRSRSFEVERLADGRVVEKAAVR
jgi:hypothetical protein